ncbi:hypothetical protein ACEPAI_7849 [Sanghuangporus weigelae]
MNTSSTPSAPRPARQRRHSSFDDETMYSLEKQLAQRPDKHELIERNILKDDRVAPALQAAREQLEKSQLQDRLEHAITNRPKPEELVKEGILLPDEAPAASA